MGITKSLGYMKKNKTRIFFCFLLEISLIGLIIASLGYFYSPLEQSITTMKNILDETTAVETGAVSTLASREGEIQMLSQQIKEDVWRFLILMAVSFSLVNTLSYAIIMKKINFQFVLTGLSLNLLTVFSLVFIFGLILDLKTNMANTVWLPEKAIISAAIFLPILFFAYFFVSLLLVVVGLNGKYKPGEITKKYLSQLTGRFVPLLVNYIILNVVLLLIIISSFVLLLTTSNSFTMILSIITLLVIMPLFRIFSKIYFIYSVIIQKVTK